MGLDEDTAINAKLLSNSIESAQLKIEQNNFERRKNVLTYDDVMNQQRTVIYNQRYEVLTEDDISSKIESMFRGSVEGMFAFCFGSESVDDYRFDEFKNHYLGMITDSKNMSYTKEELEALDKDAWREELVQNALEIYRAKDKLFQDAFPDKPDIMREIEKRVLLENVDTKWMEHLENMDELKGYVGLNSYAQRDPVAIYRLEGADMFDKMSDDIREDTVRKLLSIIPNRTATQERRQIAKPTFEGYADGKSAVKRKPVKVVKVGRNDPCPCGSGKKYKKCCGVNSSTTD